MGYFFLKKSISLIFLILIISCTEDTSNAKALKNSFWVGGADGGVNIVINSIQDERITATIYYENGEVWYSGKFKGVPENIPIKELNESSTYTSWDGEIIYLTNNRHLTPIGE